MFKKKLSKASKAKQQKPIFKQDYFNNCHRTYSCIHCRAHLANHDELISKLFQGNHGRAYLFNKVVNVGCKQAVQRELLTGLHAVADIYCDSCETTLGWKYEQAFVPSQKYKEGKYIIELAHMLKENDWDLTSYNTRELFDEIKTTKLKQESQLLLRRGRKKEPLGSDGSKKIRREINKIPDTFEETKNKYNSIQDVINMPITTSNSSDTTSLKLNQPHNSNEPNNSSPELKGVSSNKSNKSKQNHYETKEKTLNYINHNNREEFDRPQLNSEILSDGIELIERSLNRTHLSKENSNGSLSSSSNNSYYMSNSQSNLGLVDSSSGEKTFEHKMGCEDLDVTKSSDYTLSDFIIRKENSPD